MKIRRAAPVAQFASFETFKQIWQKIKMDLNNFMTARILWKGMYMEPFVNLVTLRTLKRRNKVEKFV